MRARCCPHCQKTLPSKRKPKPVVLETVRIYRCKEGAVIEHVGGYWYQSQVRHWIRRRKELVAQGETCEATTHISLGRKWAAHVYDKQPRFKRQTVRTEIVPLSSLPRALRPR